MDKVRCAGSFLTNQNIGNFSVDSAWIFFVGLWFLVLTTVSFLAIPFIRLFFVSKLDALLLMMHYMCSMHIGGDNGGVLNSLGMYVCNIHPH